MIPYFFVDGVTQISTLGREYTPENKQLLSPFSAYNVARYVSERSGWYVDIQYDENFHPKMVVYTDDMEKMSFLTVKYGKSISLDTLAQILEKEKKDGK